MDVSDVQISDEDGSVPQHDDQSKQEDRERANSDARFSLSPANQVLSGFVKNCRAKIGTDDTDDDSQQGPEHTEARPRADSSSVGGCNNADLEQTAAQSPGSMLQISSRQQTSLREREKESANRSTQQG